MGNCVQSSSTHGAGQSRLVQLQTTTTTRRRTSGGMEEEEEGHQGALARAPAVVKVKMVLTKDELGWLVARLKAGDRRLEDVLHEMAARKREERGPSEGWRPSLESIVECPAETGASGDGLAACSGN